MELGEEAKLLRWKEQFPIIAGTCTDRRYFITARDKTEVNIFADASVCTGISTFKNERILWKLSFCPWKMQSGTDEAFEATIRTTSINQGSEVERTNSQGARNGDK